MNYLPGSEINTRLVLFYFIKMKIYKFIKKIGLSLFMTTLFLVMFIYPWIVISFLNPAPTPSELEHVMVKIQEVRERSPTLKTISTNGKEMNFDIPPNGYAIIQGFPRSSFLYERKNNLENQSCLIKYDEMRFIPLKRTNRVWEIDCINYFVSFQENFKRFEKNKNNGGWLIAIYLTFGLLLCLMCYYADWIKK